jgi:hypothetical protein
MKRKIIILEHTDLWINGKIDVHERFKWQQSFSFKERYGENVREYMEMKATPEEIEIQNNYIRQIMIMIVKPIDKESEEYKYIKSSIIDEFK